MSEMFASTRRLLENASRQKYAVGAFNINNMEIMQGVVNAAAKLRSPVILATSEGALAYAGIDFLHALAETAAKKNKIPISLHLDHGKDINLIKKAIQRGYSSVMIDASHESFEKNTKLTKKVVDYAQNRGIPVEAELGTIGGAEDQVSSRRILYTDPEAAREFVERTGCNFLAVAVGTSHGAYKFSSREEKKRKEKLHLNLIHEIKEKVKIPLVLHGASGIPRSIVQQAEKYGALLQGAQGIPEADISKAIKYGISKVNIDSDLRIAFNAAVRKSLHTQKKDTDPRHILAPARELIQKVVEQKIKLFGSGGKA